MSVIVLFPVNESTLVESLTNINVGTELILYDCTKSESSSTLTLISFTLVVSKVSSNLSIAGFIALQGPHHGAEKYNISNIPKDNKNISNFLIKNKKTAIF
jgi:hypothetical protein